VAAIAASAEPVRTFGSQGVISSETAAPPSDKARQLAALNRTMRRLSCDRPETVAAAGADAAGRLLAQGEIEVAQAKPKAAQGKVRQADASKARRGSRFTNGFLLAPPQSGSAPPKRRSSCFAGRRFRSDRSCARQGQTPPDHAMAKHRLLFVCLGNICRSPMAEGAFRRVAQEEGLLDRFEIDSAGLGNWHVGQAPDTRAQAAAADRDIDISSLSARQVTPADFAHFDLLLAMDSMNHAELTELAPPDAQHKIRCFLDFAPHANTRDVPDPFYGGREGFDHALDLIEEAARGLLTELLDGEGARHGEVAGRPSRFGLRPRTSG
jgi:protein-tyrosine phosphatase